MYLSKKDFTEEEWAERLRLQKAEASLRHHNKNKEENNRKSRERYRKNKEKDKDKRKAYYEKNRAKKIAYAKKWNAENRERVADNNKQWHTDNPDWSKEYYAKHKNVKKSDRVPEGMDPLLFKLKKKPPKREKPAQYKRWRILDANGNVTKEWEAERKRRIALKENS